MQPKRSAELAGGEVSPHWPSEDETCQASVYHPAQAWSPTFAMKQTSGRNETHQRLRISIRRDDSVCRS